MSNNNGELQIVTPTALESLNRSEIDVQIATAKSYPRDLMRSLEKIKQYAMIDKETAEDCFYALKRGQGNDEKVIEGLSVRLAEIFAGAWGNLRVQTRIIANDGSKITAQGVCHDLETNLAVSTTVDRSIKSKSGATYSNDMQVVTGNAASSIAFRNAVFKVIPKAITKSIVNEVKQLAFGQDINIEEATGKAMAWFAQKGVSSQQVLEHLGLMSADEITKESIVYLRGLVNAINEGTATIQDTFKKNEYTGSSAATDAAKAKADEIKAKADAAKAKSTKKEAKEVKKEEPVETQSQEAPVSSDAVPVAEEKPADQESPY